MDSSGSTFVDICDRAWSLFLHLKIQGSDIQIHQIESDNVFRYCMK